MELNSFSIFLTVAEEMNFTRAAEKLYITQQSLSGHIKRLEKIYGVDLFQRRPFLKLTPEGEAMVQFAMQMLESENNMLARFADINQNCSGIVNLGMSRLRSQVFFPGIWRNYRAAHPNINVRLHERVTQFLIDELQAGRVDIMIGINAPKAANLDMITLIDEYNYCVINESLLQKHFPEKWQDMLERFKKDGADLHEMLDLPLILLPEPNTIRRPLNQIYYRAHKMPDVILETNEQSVIFDVACQGDGIGILNSATVYANYLAKRTMPENCHIFRIQGFPKNRVSLVTRNDIEKPRYVEDLKELIIGEFRHYNSVLEELVP